MSKSIAWPKQLTLVKKRARAFLGHILCLSDEGTLKGLCTHVPKHGNRKPARQWTLFYNKVHSMSTGNLNSYARLNMLNTAISYGTRLFQPEKAWGPLLSSWGILIKRSMQIDLWLTLPDPSLTFDPSIALCSIPSDFVSTEHFQANWFLQRCQSLCSKNLKYLSNTREVILLYIKQLIKNSLNSSWKTWWKTLNSG